MTDPTTNTADGPPRVDVVIPTWDSRERLPTVLGSLDVQRAGPLRVTIVDNGSRDDTVAFMHARDTDARVIELGINRGFSAAVNAGIAAGDAELVALINDDVELEPDCLAELIRALDGDGAAASAAPKLLDFDERGMLDGAGDAMSRYGAVWRRGKGERDDGRYDHPERIVSACGAVALYRRAALDAVGGFDERFFAYVEDVDWGLRAQLRGWHALYVPSARAYHAPSSSGARLGWRAEMMIVRNTVATVVKNFPPELLRRHALRLLFHQAVLLGQGLSGARPLRAVVGSWGSLLRMLPALLRERRRIQAAVSAPAYRIDAVLTREYPGSPRLLTAAMRARNLGRRLLGRIGGPATHLDRPGVLRAKLWAVAADARELVARRGESPRPPRRYMFVGGADDFDEVGEEFVGHLVKLAGLTSSSRVLDVGCGIGRMALPLTQRLGTDGSYEGFDIVELGIRWSERNITARHPNFRFTHADIVNGEYNPRGHIRAEDFRFPYPDDDFDVALLTSVFTHMLPAEVERYASELGRVLRPGGRCLLTAFLLNEQSRALIDAERSAFAFDSADGVYGTVDDQITEAAVSYDERWMMDTLARHGLQLKAPVHYGSWCGRDDPLSFQDIVVVRRADAPV